MTPDQAPGIPVSVVLDHPTQPMLGKRVTGSPRRSMLYLPDLCNLLSLSPRWEKQHCCVATATAGTCQHLSR